jgi:hypothetical protein
LAAAVVLLVLVVAYDFGRPSGAGAGLYKLRRWIGFLNMGACRGVSVMLGAAAAASPQDLLPAVAAAVGIGLYITIVSVIAADETRQSFLSRYVGQLIRFLIVIQAGLCLFAGGIGVWAAPIILAGWPASRWLGRRFYAS